MTEDQAIELIGERFTSQWPTVSLGIIDGGGAVPFSLENEALPNQTFFALCTVVHTTAEQITHGQTATRRVERKGFVMVKLWVPVDRGRKMSALLCGAARAVFEGIDIATGVEPITILAGATREVGVQGPWYMCVVAFPMRYYATF